MWARAMVMLLACLCRGSPANADVEANVVEEAGASVDAFERAADALAVADDLGEGKGLITREVRRDGEKAHQDREPRRFKERLELCSNASNVRSRASATQRATASKAGRPWRKAWQAMLARRRRAKKAKTKCRCCSGADAGPRQAPPEQGLSFKRGAKKLVKGVKRGRKGARRLAGRAVSFVKKVVGKAAR